MIRIIKSSKKFWSCSNKEKNYRQEQRGECSSFCQARQKFCSAFVSSFLQTKNLKIYQEFIKKTANPERRFGIAGKDKTCRHFLFQPSNVLSAWGRARHFLSTGHVIARWAPGKQREEEHHHTKPGGGAARRGRWLGLLGGWWNAGNFDKNSSPGGSSVRDLFRNLLFNPVESCPPFIRRIRNITLLRWIELLKVTLTFRLWIAWTSGAGGAQICTQWIQEHLNSETKDISCSGNL